MSEDGIARRYALAGEFGGVVEDTPSVLNITWFSVEAPFHLDGYISHQNVRYGVLENLRHAVRIQRELYGVYYRAL
jgi:hypothetical protein